MRRPLHLPANNVGTQAFLTAVSLQLRGQRLTRVRRSFGSVLLIDLGKIRRVHVRKSIHQEGEWHFLVDGAWKIVKNKKTLLEWRYVTDEIIDARIPRLLEGKEIKQVSIRRSGSMEIYFTDGTQLTMKKFVYDKDYTGGWCLFCRDLWWVANGTDKKDYPIEFSVMPSRLGLRPSTSG